MPLSKQKQQQVAYKKYTFIKNKIFINGTSLLIFRDMLKILKQYCFHKPCVKPYQYLDFGCGTALSTDIYSKMMQRFCKKLAIHGMDINSQNLSLARVRIPNGIFKKVTLKSAALYHDYFDTITCNLVLLEHPYSTMLNILKQLHTMLKPQGILIAVNCSIESYDPKYEWYSFNNNFSINQDDRKKGAIFSIKEDARVKIKKYFPDANNRKIYVDYFHSESDYQKAFKASGFKILKTYKPLGKANDGLPWKSEKIASPYLIHILQKK